VLGLKILTLTLDSISAVFNIEWVLQSANVALNENSAAQEDKRSPD